MIAFGWHGSGRKAISPANGRFLNGPIYDGAKARSMRHPLSKRNLRGPAPDNLTACEYANAPHRRIFVRYLRRLEGQRQRVAGRQAHIVRPSITELPPHPQPARHRPKYDNMTDAFMPFFLVARKS